MLLTVSGIPIEVSRKSIKSIYLYVKPPNGDVTVSAPLFVSDEAILQFVRSKLDWLTKHVSKYENQPPQTKREYVSGETLCVWGKEYCIETKIGSKNSLTLIADKAVFTIRNGSTTEKRERFVRGWYRELLKEEIARLLPKWESITGLKATSWQTKDMTTRWGTCNTGTGKIWLNLQLAKKPPECLEYVVLHELVHLAEKKHNKRFYSLMDQYMPQWKELKKTLNMQVD